MERASYGHKGTAGVVGKGWEGTIRDLAWGRSSVLENSMFQQLFSPKGAKDRTATVLMKIKFKFL